jgi:hypothetical protein
LTSATHTRIFAEFSAATGVGSVTIGAGQTIRGTGNIGANQAKLVNQGRIIADHASLLTIDASDLSDAFFNRGTIEVNAGSTLTVVGGASFIQDAVEASTSVTGTMNIPLLQLQGGTLGGNGTIVGTVQNTGGIVAPGASPGKTTISGNYSQGPNGQLLAELNGIAQGDTYDWLHVTGTATLGGTLDLRFGFTPALGSQFMVVTAGNSLSGTFSSIMTPAGIEVLPVYGANNFSLTVTAVPESETYAMILTGLGLVTWAVRRRTRRARSR